MSTDDDQTTEPAPTATRTPGGSRRAAAPGRGVGARLGSLRVRAAIVVGVLVLLAGTAFGVSRMTDDDGGGDGGGAGAGAEQAAAEDAQPATEAEKAAATVLTTWARPTLGYRAWWSDFRPLLTPGGREAYAYTDPQELPTLGEVEPVETVVHRPGAIVTVYFATAQGRFGVDLSRSSQGDPWLANRVLFPGSESMFG